MWSEMRLFVYFNIISVWRELDAVGFVFGDGWLWG